MFNTAFKYYKTPRGKTNQIIALKSKKKKELSKERLKFTTTSNNSLAPEITSLNHAKVKVKFDGSFLK